MSPTVFRKSGFRFYFYSREEPRMHVHIHGQFGEAKFWMEPNVELAYNYRLRDGDLKLIKKMIEDHENDIRAAWKRHFGS